MGLVGVKLRHYQRLRTDQLQREQRHHSLHGRRWPFHVQQPAERNPRAAAATQDVLGQEVDAACENGARGELLLDPKAAFAADVADSDALIAADEADWRRTDARAQGQRACREV